MSWPPGAGTGPGDHSPITTPMPPRNRQPPAGGAEPRGCGGGAATLTVPGCPDTGVMAGAGRARDQHGDDTREREARARVTPRRGGIVGAPMPLQNRVTPFGDLIATEARGLLMGNRGRLHDAGRRIVRYAQGRRWIACLTSFRGRRRTVMSPGSYTELFFLDEAVALSAGHRPCAECRRQDYLRFQPAWARAGLGPASA